METLFNPMPFLPSNLLAPLGPLVVTALLRLPQPGSHPPNPH